VTNEAHGHAAEKLAADYLQHHGYRVLALNWRRPRAEIDIVAQAKHGPLTFVEVKYRQTTQQGGGLDYITERKLHQMRFAAELWVAETGYVGEYVLAALALGGPDYQVTDFVAELT